jgi:hypothetical protein
MPFSACYADQAQDIDQILDTVGGLQGAGILAVVAFIVQFLMRIIQSDKFMGGKVGQLAGKWRLLIVNSLSLIGGIIALMAPPSNQSFIQAALNSQTLAMAMVFGNQVLKQFKKNE